MNILSVESISKQYGERPLFRDVSFGLNKADRVGIIGVNGSGKTSLLRIVAGVEPPDSGRVVVTSNAHVVYLPQSPPLDDQLSVIDAVFAGDSPTIQLLRSYEQTSAALSEQPQNEQLLLRLNELSGQMDALNAWDAEANARIILSQLGLAEVMHQQTGELSGGQRKRVAMARALVDKPDLLILDEPTNHIDTDTIAWLEGYLARSQSALLLVTHDRYFLDRIVTRMIELDRGKVFSYVGNYSRFLEQKAEREVQAVAAEEARANLLRRELAWLRRGARARTTKQQAHVDRVHGLMNQRPETRQGTVEIDLEQSRRLGKRVLELRNISKSYGERRLINKFSLELQPNDRLGIIGPNGSGKTSLLNIIAGTLAPDSGERIIGETVHLAYYDQESVGLNENQRVVDYIREAAELVRGRDGALVAATQMLERFLFPPEAQWSLIGTLSGGERRRLYLLRTLVFTPNVLLLDEPTNDLDIQTLTILEDYLDTFKGAVVAVSHDRYFLDRVAERIIAFEEQGQLVEYPGNYSLYAEYRAQKIAEAPAKPAKANPSARPVSAEQPRRLSGKEKRELTQLETQISELEQQRDTVGAQLNAAGNDYQQYTRLANELQQIEQRLEQAFERWTELAELAES
jgi:ABC transport system ATP-binding/permease protein